MSVLGQKMETARSTIGSGGNISVQGGPGSGKSHFLRSLSRELTDAQGVRVASLDLSTVSDGRQAFREIVRLVSGTKPKAGNIRDAWVAVGDMAANSGLVCLALDEFDSVTQFADGDIFIRLLRELVQNPRDSKVCALVASRRSIRVIEECVKGISNLEGVLTPLHLSTLSRVDIIGGWPSSEVSSADLPALLAWSGGVPRLVDAYVSSVLDDSLHSGSAEVRRHEWLVRELDYLDTLGLAGAAAQYVLGPITRPDPISRSLLVAMGIVVDGRAKSGEAEALGRFGFFVDGLRGRVEASLTPWAGLGELELISRRLIRKVLRPFAENTSSGVAFQGLPRSVSFVLSRAVARLGGEARSVQEMSSVVAELQLGDHWIVVDGLWDGLPESIKRLGREYWRSRLSITGGIGRSPGERRVIDEVEIGLWVRDLERVLTSDSPDVAGNGALASGGVSANASNVTVRAGKGAVVSVGTATHSTSTSDRRVPRMGIWAWIGWIAGVLGGIATVLTLVFYLVDRGPK